MKIRLLLLAILISILSIPAHAGTIKGKDILTAVKAHIRKEIKWPEEKLEISETVTVQDIETPRGPASFSLKKNRIAGTGKFYTVPVIITQDGSILKTIYVTCKVSRFEDVVVSLKGIKKHETIKMEDVLLERKDISSIKDYRSLITNVDDVIGKRSSEYLSAGELLETSSYERLPIVSKKQQIKAIGKLGTIKAELTGIAMEEGYEGDIIQVMNPLTKKTFMAKVMKDNHVEVIF